MDEEHPTVPEAVDRPLIAVEVVATKTEDEAVLTVVVVAVATTAVDVVVASAAAIEGGGEGAPPDPENKAGELYTSCSTSGASVLIVRQQCLRPQRAGQH